MAKFRFRLVKSTLVESFSVPGARTPGRLATWSKDTPELPLILSLVAEAFLQLLASGLGTLALVWATVVLLGGYSNALVRTDFWFTTAIVFVQIARIVGYNSAPEAKFFVDVPAAFYQLKRHDLRGAIATKIVSIFAIGSTWIALTPILLAAACMVLSIIRLVIIGGSHGYRSSRSGNLKPALILFYGLVLVQVLLFILWLVVAVNRLSSVEILTKKYSSWQQLLLQQQQQSQQLQSQRLQRQLLQLEQQPKPQSHQQWQQEQRLLQQLQQLPQWLQQELQQLQQQPQPQTQQQRVQEQRLLQKLQQHPQWLQQQLQQLQQQPRPQTRQQWMQEQRLQQQLQQLLLQQEKKNLPRKLIDRYVNSIAETCIQKGVASTINSTLISFAAELLLQSDDQDDHSSAVVVLHSLVVTEPERSGKAAEQICSSEKLFKKLLWLLHSNNPVTKVCTAEIVVELASNCELRLVDIPGGARWISSLLDPQFMKKEEETIFFVRGLEILGKLASDPENCREIYNTMDLVPKIIAPVSNGLHMVMKDDDSATTVEVIIAESLRVVAKLTSGTGESSRKLCQELTTEKYGRTAKNILWILDNSSDQDMRFLAVEILSRLTLDDSTMSEFTEKLRSLLFDTEDSHSPPGIEAGKALVARGDEFADFKQLEVLMSGDEYSKEYRAVTAEMLAQVFAKPAEDADRYKQQRSVAHALLSKVLQAIVDETKDIKLDKRNMKFLASFLGLAAQIREQLLVTVEAFANAVTGLSRMENNIFAEKLKMIIEMTIDSDSNNKNEGEVCLAIIKAATKLVTWTMEIDTIGPGYYIEYFQRPENNIVEKLDAAVKAMAHLERYMIMKGGADEKEGYVTLGTLVETAKKMLEVGSTATAAATAADATAKDTMVVFPNITTAAKKKLEQHGSTAAALDDDDDYEGIPFLDEDDIVVLPDITIATTAAAVVTAAPAATTGAGAADAISQQEQPPQEQGQQPSPPSPQQQSQEQGQQLPPPPTQKQQSQEQGQQLPPPPTQQQQPPPQEQKQPLPPPKKQQQSSLLEQGQRPPAQEQGQHPQEQEPQQPPPPPQEQLPLPPPPQKQQPLPAQEQGQQPQEQEEPQPPQEQGQQMPPPPKQQTPPPQKQQPQEQEQHLPPPSLQKQLPPPPPLPPPQKQQPPKPQGQGQQPQEQEQLLPPPSPGTHLPPPSPQKQQQPPSLEQGQQPQGQEQQLPPPSPRKQQPAPPLPELLPPPPQKQQPLPQEQQV